MINWKAIGSLFRRASALQWAPTLTAHDPNPPLNLEDPVSGNITGTSANAQTPATSLASGILTVSASGEPTQQPATYTASGALTVSGTAAGSQEEATTNSDGFLIVSSEGNGNQAVSTSTASGTVSSVAAPVVGGGAKPKRKQHIWPVPPPRLPDLVYGDGRSIVWGANSAAMGGIVMAGSGGSNQVGSYVRANGSQIISGTIKGGTSATSGRASSWLVDDNRDLIEMLLLIK